MNRGLPVLEAARGLDSWRRPEGSRPLGTRMSLDLIIVLFTCRLGIRACMILVPLLGATWLFGFLSPFHIAFTYIFVILNSTQVKIN